MCCLSESLLGMIEHERIDNSYMKEERQGVWVLEISIRKNPHIHLTVAEKMEEQVGCVEEKLMCEPWEIQAGFGGALFMGSSPGWRQWELTLKRKTLILCCRDGSVCRVLDFRDRGLFPESIRKFWTWTHICNPSTGQVKTRAHYLASKAQEMSYIPTRDAVS